MMANFTSNYIKVNDIELHYLHYPNEGKKILMLLHGLTANCMAFQGLISNNLTENFELIIPDLRGRGKSTHPAFGYSFKNHANDILGLIKNIKNREIILVGHSFGGLLSSYLCFFYPTYFSKVIFLDAAPEMNKKTPLMLQASLGRLDKKYNSIDEYFNQIKKAPYIDFWDENMEAYYHADIDISEDGSVESKPDIMQILQIATYVSKEPFNLYFKSLKQPALIVNGDGVYNLDEAILPTRLAVKALSLLKSGSLFTVNGNHHTMLYGAYAREIVKEINVFVA